MGWWEDTVDSTQRGARARLVGVPAAEKHDRLVARRKRARRTAKVCAGAVVAWWPAAAAAVAWAGVPWWVPLTTVVGWAASCLTAVGYSIAIEALDREINAVRRAVFDDAATHLDHHRHNRRDTA